MAKTAKGKKTLYALPDEYKKVCYQPNHITNAVYSYTLIQERIFNYIIFYLQSYMGKVMNGGIITQLDIFDEKQKDYIDIDIPLSLIGKPFQYPEIRQRAIEMLSVPVQTKIVSKKFKGDTIRMQSWITHVDVPMGDERRRTGVLPIRISKSVAMLMLNIERDGGCPINYTSFLFNVALLADNKYTSRLYKYLSSYKPKPDEKQRVHTMDYQRLRDMLDIGPKYQDYEAFKRCVLLPVQTDLKDNLDSDIIFEFSETRNAKKQVVKVNMIVKRVEDEDSKLTECKLWNSIEGRLTSFFECDKGGAIAVINKLKDKVTPRVVLDKIVDCCTYYLEHLHDKDPRKRINDKSAYVIGTLKREFL